MAATEKLDLSSAAKSEGSLDSMLSRRGSFRKGSTISYPFELMNESTFTCTCDIFSVTSADFFNIDKIMRPPGVKVSCVQHDKPQIDSLDELRQNVCVKSKRSSSASNDQLLERARFRARFESFNTSGSAVEENHVGENETLGNEFEDISSKTKKLNIRSKLKGCMDQKSEPPIVKDTARLEPDAPPNKSYGIYHGSKENEDLLIHKISLKQLSEVFYWYFNEPLPPTCQMFPWLHGLHKDNFAQCSFFGISKESKQSFSPDLSPREFNKPELARFIMCVETKMASPKDRPNMLRNTVSVEEILQPIEYARSEVKTIVREIVLRVFSPDTHPSLDLMVFADSVFRDSLATGFMPIFVNSDPKRGISLRNFQIQASKVAASADFVVYCCEDASKNGGCRCMAFARLLKVAQTAENSEDPSKYKVLILEHFEGMDRSLSNLWTVRDDPRILQGSDPKKKTQLHLHGFLEMDSDTFACWDADYQVKEKLETTVMSAATRMYLNVWAGNIWDYQILMQMLRTQNQFQVIEPLDEGRNIYCDPACSLVTRKFTSPHGTNLISLLPPPRGHWKLFVHCHGDAAFPSQELLSDLLFKYAITSRKPSDVKEIHHIDFPSSGSIGFGDCRQDSLTSIINTCKLLYLYSSSLAKDSLASLIYCSDGYTELSLLIFCFLMYAEDIDLEAAILKLHKDYGRPFYVFGSDVKLLTKLEVVLRNHSPARPSNAIVWSQCEIVSQREINSAVLKTKREDNTDTGSIPRKLRLGYIASESDSEHSDSGIDDDPVIGLHSHKRSWVEDLEGSIPSRILPYMYLGSLKHAKNLSVLSKLGITNIISVGESLDWFDCPEFQRNNEIHVEAVKEANVEIISINRHHGDHSSPKKCTKVSTILKLNNVLDDGIDDLSGFLPTTLEYIEEEYTKSNGRTKFLVHCRVGVSRSATVVIAEVMRRLNITLPQAYLYVRVRRLNIVIQPNLRFMYELFKWEEFERRNSELRGNLKSQNDLRTVDWFVFCQEIKKLNLPFTRT